MWSYYVSNTSAFYLIFINTLLNLICLLIDISFIFFTLSSFSSFCFSKCFVFRRSFSFLRCHKYSLFSLSKNGFVYICLFNPPGVYTHTFSLIPLCVFKEMHVCCRKFGKQNLEGRVLLLFIVPYTKSRRGRGRGLSVACACELAWAAGPAGLAGAVCPVGASALSLPLRYCLEPS